MTTSSIAGFDFGTSNCALGVVDAQQPRLLTLPEHGQYMPSTMFAPHADMISGWLFRALEQHGLEQAYQQARSETLNSSLRAMRELKLDGYGDQLSFGKHALHEYLDDPADCYYVRSPKSFLGASGLPERQQQRFEDICAAMMLHLKQHAEQVHGQRLEKVVIGRPVNFQGLDSEQSNQQALAILTKAAKFVGFKQVEFLYEPMAAGLAYQHQLSEERKVMVVDIGGGTSDVSMLTMGPGYLDSHDHQQLVLGYSGERIGGNDFDIALNMEALMPELGAGMALSSGRNVPGAPFWDAAAVNNFPAQMQFYSKETRLLIQDLIKQGAAPLKRLQTLQQERMTYQLSACAEQAKIALSQHATSQVELDFLDDGLSTEVSQQHYQQASDKLLSKIIGLADQVVAQAGCLPDQLFLTGGSANSPLVKQALEQHFKLPMISGDNFGSVTSGLALWAERIYQD